MRVLWRISNHCDLQGMGGEKSDGRWHTAQRGKRIVYFSEHPALALIEVIANLKGNSKLFPDAYQLMKVTIADQVTMSAVAHDRLSSDWPDDLSQTKAIGDSWFGAGEFALLAVPSAPAPESTNYLFNPLHAEAKGAVIDWCRWIKYDQRLFHLS